MIALSAFDLVFRLVHITAGVLWVGSSFLFLTAVAPTAAQLGPAAGPMMTALGQKVPKTITPLAVSTVLAGWVLWVKRMVDYDSLGDWVSSRFGLVLTIGGVLATAALLEGLLILGPKSRRMAAVGGQIAAQGGPPTPEQQSEIEGIQGALRKGGARSLVMLILSVVAMATARYW